METPQQMPGSRLVAGDTVSIVQAPDSAGVALDEALVEGNGQSLQSLPLFLREGSICYAKRSLL